VVGTVALRMLLRDDATSDQQQMLRGESVESPAKVVGAPIIDNKVSDSETKGDSDDVYTWAYEEDSKKLGERSLVPSRGSDSIEAPKPLSGTNVSRRTNLFAPEEGDNSGFSLKLYWREGYYWQEVRNVRPSFV